MKLGISGDQFSHPIRASGNSVSLVINFAGSISMAAMCWTTTSAVLRRVCWLLAVAEMLHLLRVGFWRNVSPGNEASSCVDLGASSKLYQVRQEEFRLRVSYEERRPTCEAPRQFVDVWFTRLQLVCTRGSAVRFNAFYSVCCVTLIADYVGPKIY